MWNRSPLQGSEYQEKEHEIRKELEENMSRGNERLRQNQRNPAGRKHKDWSNAVGGNYF